MTITPCRECGLTTNKIPCPGCGADPLSRRYLELTTEAWEEIMRWAKECPDRGFLSPAIVSVENSDVAGSIFPSNRNDVIELIDEFIAEDSRRAQSFADLVLRDLDLSDHAINRCLRQAVIDEWFSLAKETKEYQEDLTRLRDDLIMFLRMLLEIPEYIRER